jgi:cob(I)alamin adenosyltransferase
MAYQHDVIFNSASHCWRDGQLQAAGVYMKIYTKTGDYGTTDVIGGRLDKDDCRVDAYGTLDELNSWLGLALTQMHAQPRYADIVAVLNDIQQQLFACCADLATLDPILRPYSIQTRHTEQLECLIDQYDEELPHIAHFIIPGGNQMAAMLHVCRTVTRRAERRVVTLMHATAAVNAEVLPFLNRLSDFFFTLARLCDARAGISEVMYLQQ